MTRLTDAITRPTGSVAMPGNRKNELLSPWWIAFLGALGALLGLLLFFPDPCLKLLKFVPGGILVTLQITLSAMVLALLLGLVTGFGRVSRNRLIHAIASTYVEVVRGIPLLVQLFLIYYALERLVGVSDMAAVVVAISFCYGAYMAEVFRAGVEAVDRTQTEAARALGFNPTQALRYVILPQAWRTILPRVGKESIALLKDTSLVSILAIADLMGRGREFAAESLTTYETYTMIALIYLLITLILSRLVNLMEARLSHHVRP